MTLIRLALLASLCAVVCHGSSLRYGEDLPEINLPGIILPDIDQLLDDNADPTPCCLPKQWQGTATSQSGWRLFRGGRAEEEGEDLDRRGHRHRRGGFKANTVNVYVDENSKKVATRGKCFNDTCGSIVVFGSNNTADVYLFAMGAQKCWHNKTNHAEFREQCVPKNSTFEGSVKIGPAAGGLGVNVWKFHGKPHHRSNAPRIYVSGKAVVTGDTCIPVVFQERGVFFIGRRSEDGATEAEDVEALEELDGDLNDPNPHPRPHRLGGVFMGSSYFNNVEASIKDPSIFTPPSYCKSIAAPGGNLKLDVDMEYPDILDRFVVLN